MNKLNEQHRCQAQGNAKVQNVQLVDNRWENPQLSTAAGHSTMALTTMLVTVEQHSYGTSGQTNWTAGVSPMIKKVSVCVSSRWSTRIHPPTQAWKEVSHGWIFMSRTHHQSYGTSAQPNWPAGVSLMMKKVSLCVMSRMSTRIHPPTQA
jgi:hypothetical protein